MCANGDVVPTHFDDLVPSQRLQWHVVEKNVPSHSRSTYKNCCRQTIFPEVRIGVQIIVVVAIVECNCHRFLGQRSLSLSKVQDLD
jgi:hypothetical protein